MIRRLLGTTIAVSGLVCPCHALVGLAVLLGAPSLSPVAQEGLHGVYVPVALVVGVSMLPRLGRSQR